jgi:hypothetical protein
MKIQTFAKQYEKEGDENHFSSSSPNVRQKRLKKYNKKVKYVLNSFHFSNQGPAYLLHKKTIIGEKPKSVTFEQIKQKAHDDFFEKLKNSKSQNLVISVFQCHFTHSNDCQYKQ